MQIRNILTVLVLFTVFNSVYSQNTHRNIGEDRLISFGLFGGYNYNIFKTDIKQVPGVPNCCPQFKDGTGSSFSAGLMVELPLVSFKLLGLNNNLVASLRGGLFGYGGQLKADEKEYVILKSLNDQKGEADVEHTIDVTIWTIGIEPALKLRFYKGLSLSMGVNAGFPARKRFKQAETLVNPANEGTFENGKRVRNDTSGVLGDFQNILYFGTAGLHYELPLDSKGTFWLEPDIYYSFGLNSIIKTDKWKISSIQGALTIKYMPERRLATPLKPEK